MTKAELLLDLSTRYQLGTLIDETTKLSAEDQVFFANEHIKIYRQIVHERIEGKMIRRAILFYVSHEGEGGEEAFYKDRLPLDAVPLEPVVSFQQTVETEIQNRVNANQLLRGQIREINEDKNWAVVRVFREVANVAEEEDYLVYEKPDTTIGFIVANLKPVFPTT